VQSNQAKKTSDLANGSANAATGAASNAMSLASGARKEADSFENDIVSAKEQAAKAESDLAGALVACRSEVVTDEGAFHKFHFHSATAHSYRASRVSTNVVSATGH
jgi:hypothetical protein